MTQLQKIVAAVKPTYDAYQAIQKDVYETIKNNLNEITNQIKQISNVLTPVAINIQDAIHKMQESIIEILKGINNFSISEERKNELVCNYKRWGKFGWTILPDAPIDIFNVDPISYRHAQNIALQFCKRNNIKNL